MCISSSLQCFVSSFVLGCPGKFAVLEDIPQVVSTLVTLVKLALNFVLCKLDS